MASEHQSNTSGESWGSEAEKMLAKDDQVVRACIDGLRTIDDARAWIEAEIEGQRRKGVIGRLNRRIDELK